MIPTGSNYPTALDTNDNLFLVHDSLRVQLLDDYSPGDTKITVTGDTAIMAKFPVTGIITLTEQCSELDLRALSFYYSAFDSTTGIFSGLELLPEFQDNPKAKRITNVTLNVIAHQHNSIKDAVIAIQSFFGKKGTVDTQPFGPTLEGRTNFLRNVALQPKAWFTSDVQMGIVPLTVMFKDLSFRLATDGKTDNYKVTYDFGDQDISVISGVSTIVSDINTISATTEVPSNAIDVYVQDTDDGTIKKTYYKPGIYTVKITVENNFGQDVCVFEDYIKARVKAPDVAVVQFVANAGNQIVTPGVPVDGPYTTPPTIRSPVNVLINLEIPTGENPNTPNISWAGEQLDDSGNPVDPIVTWTWALSDDLNHPNSRDTKASYSIGGLYDMKLRVDTEFGAYRITSYDSVIDVVETTNLWLWIFQDDTNVRAYEYGLISETFKLTSAPTFAITRNDSFLTGAPSELQQKAEFARNTGFAQQSNTGSGLGGNALLYWASGRNPTDPVTSETINVVQFEGFTHTYITEPSITRQWNWMSLNSPSNTYFMFGNTPSYAPSTSPTNLVQVTLNYLDLSTTTTTFALGNFLNGASELMHDVSIYSPSGDSIYGHFSVYRSAWKDSTGYFVRNDGIGPFFRLKSFYRTEGTIGAPFQNIRKMQDMQGPTKLEGELVNMTDGVYFLNNTGSLSRFDTTANAWQTGGPGVNSLLYRGLQDTSVAGYDDPTNRLLCASDGDERAYLSFDYSPNAFIRFSALDTTFSTLGSRPSGTQWLIGVY